MKKITFTFLTFIFPFTFCFAQDIITKKTSEDIQAKILEVSTSEIKYKNFNNLEGPIFTLLKSDVLMVRYENGTKDIFSEKKNSKINSDLASNNADFYTQGQLDASKNYEGYKGAGTGTLVTSLVSPLIGLVPAIACSSTPPNDSNLGYPNAELIKNADYYNGYTKKAKKIKQGKVWKNWSIAFGVNLVAVLLLSSGQ